MLISNLLLPPIPIPLVHLLKVDVQAVRQVLDVLRGPIRVPLEARLEEHLLLARETVSRKSAIFIGFHFVLGS